MKDDEIQALLETRAGSAQVAALVPDLLERAHRAEAERDAAVELLRRNEACLRALINEFGWSPNECEAEQAIVDANASFLAPPESPEGAEA